MPDFLATPSACDTILLAGQRSPGVARVRPLSSPRKWDEKDGQGTSGASLVYQGDKLVHFEVAIELWEPEHFVAWDAFRLLLRKAPEGVKPTALDLSHPFVDEHEVSAVVVEDLVGPEITDQGLTTWVVKFVQFRKPTPAQGKPGGSASQWTASQGGGADAKSESDKQIEQLTKQVKELSA